MFQLNSLKMAARALSLVALGWAGSLAAQPITDIDLRANPAGDSLRVYVRPNGAPFSQIVSAMTFTIRWEAASTATLGTRTQFCAAAFSITPSPDGEVDNGGFTYRTYNAFGGSSLADECTPPGWVQDDWNLIMRVKVNTINQCTNFNIVSDAFTAATNKNYFISLNGQDRTGAIETTVAQLGGCNVDCLGNVGGPALPGTPCNDNDACTINDVYTGTPPACGCAGTFQDTDGDGTCNANDGCPNDPNKIAPGQCGCGVADTDTDADGTANCNDGCPNDPNKIAPGICGCGVADTDSDGDGTANCNDGCPNDPNKVAPGQCGCGVADTDSDGDGTANCNDGCPNDPNKIAPGICGCGVADTDSDGDGTANCNDGCPNDPNKIAPGICGCGVADTDSDGDGTANCNDGCPNDPNKIAPGVCGCGVADTDTDGDGLANCVDPCPNGPNPGATCNDNDACTINDVIQANCSCAGTFQDTDGDGTCNANDGCPNDPNKTAPGQCGCGVADTDTDGDGTANCNDLCPNDPNKIAPGICGCGVSDADTDADGTADCNDGCPNDPNKTAPGQCGCGVADTDTDSDGTANCNDGCPADPNKIAPGICGCGVADTDSDGDGTANCNDGCPNDPNKVAPGQCGCGVADTDSDSDGTPDCNDGCPNDVNKTSPGTCGCNNPEPGTTCNDNNPNTTGDVIGSNCLCAGSTVPCPDDGNPCTLEEVVLGVCLHTPLPDTDSDGTCDLIDGCPNDPNKIAPGQCGCGVSDADTDGDGTADCNDLCPNDPNKVAPGICGCGVSDADSDGDGTADCNDGCPNDPNKIAAGVCGCGVSDADGDADGTADCIDGCPADPNKIAPGVCGCGVADTDSDGDGTADCTDGCPNDPNKIAPGICGCGVSDADTDGDGTADCNDGCPADPNKTAPGQCGCGVADTDTDNDGVADCNDNCPNIAGQQGSPCDDGDLGTSGDAINANCICEGSTVPCPDDGDPCTAEVVVLGVCTHPALPDTDLDGTCDLIDGCPNDPNKIAPGICGCGVSDADTDGDLTADCNDGCPSDPNKTAPGICGCGVSDADSDGDLTVDCNDGCPNDPNKIAPGACGCGVADTDADADGVADCDDLCPNGPEPGTNCDDQDPDTGGDVITANCVCAGVNINCTEDLVLAIRLDAFGTHTTWELYETATNTLVEFGGPYSDGTPGAIVTTNLCVPAGCYDLIMSDDFGDGISAGGYVLSDDLGRRIIDADGNFISTSSVFGEFCVPLGQTFVKPYWCDRTDFVPSSWIYCQGVAGATGYQFWFFDPHGSYSRTILKPTTALRLNNLQTNPLPFNLPLNVRVRALVGGNFQQYGSACRIIVNDPNGGGNLNATYFATDEASFNMYPNPNRDEVLYLSIEGLSDLATGAEVLIHDAMGKLVSSEHVAVASGTLNHTLTMSSEMSLGMYIVQVQVDGRVFTQRLMRQ